MTLTAPPPPAAGTDAAALLAQNRRRRRIRRGITLATLPLTLAALLLAGKLLSMYAFAHHSVASFLTGAYAESETAARGLDVANWFEPFRAPYDIGTALAGGEQLPQARAELEEALTLASGLDVCAVRINLSLVIERQGDAARAEGQAAQAAELYGEALEVTVGTPEECRSDEARDQSPDPSRDMADTLDQNRQRQQEKQRQQDPQQSGQSPPDAGEQPSQGDLDEIEERLGQGAREREDQLGDDGSGGGGADKPW